MCDAAGQAITRLLRATDPVDALSLTRPCGASAIKSAYLAISKLVHPDRCDDPRATECFQVLQQHFNKIKDGVGARTTGFRPPRPAAQQPSTSAWERADARQAEELAKQWAAAAAASARREAAAAAAQAAAEAAAPAAGPAHGGASSGCGSSADPWNLDSDSATEADEADEADEVDEADAEAQDDDDDEWDDEQAAGRADEAAQRRSAAEEAEALRQAAAAAVERERKRQAEAAAAEEAERQREAAAVEAAEQERRAKAAKKEAKRQRKAAARRAQLEAAVPVDEWAAETRRRGSEWGEGACAEASLRGATAQDAVQAWRDEEKRRLLQVIDAAVGAAEGAARGFREQLTAGGRLDAAELRQWHQWQGAATRNELCAAASEVSSRAAAWLDRTLGEIEPWAARLRAQAAAWYAEEKEHVTGWRMAALAAAFALNEQDSELAAEARERVESAVETALKAARHARDRAEAEAEKAAAPPTLKAKEAAAALPAFAEAEVASSSRSAQADITKLWGELDAAAHGRGGLDEDEMAEARAEEAREEAAARARSNAARAGRLIRAQQAARREDEARRRPAGLGAGRGAGTLQPSPFFGKPLSAGPNGGGGGGGGGGSGDGGGGGGGQCRPQKRPVADGPSAVEARRMAQRVGAPSQPSSSFNAPPTTFRTRPEGPPLPSPVAGPAFGTNPSGRRPPDPSAGWRRTVTVANPRRVGARPSGGNKASGSGLGLGGIGGGLGAPRSKLGSFLSR